MRLQLQPHRPPVLRDSITASSTPCSWSHADKRRNSLGRVANRRRSGFASGACASMTTTIRIFLCTSIPAILSAIATSRRGSGRKRAQRNHTPSRATNRPTGMDGATQIGSNTHPRPNSLTASTDPEYGRSSPFHAHSIVKAGFETIFIPMGGPQPMRNSLEIPSGFPHSHALDGWIYVFSSPLNSNHRHRKGLVTDVSGPQRNACPGTLTP